jgi:hypothetical protein
VSQIHEEFFKLTCLPDVAAEIPVVSAPSKTCKPIATFNARPVIRASKGTLSEYSQKQGDTRGYRTEVLLLNFSTNLLRRIATSPFLH